MLLIVDSAFLKTLRSHPFQENILELFVEDAIDQSIDACRKVEQESSNKMSILNINIKLIVKDNPDAVKRVTDQENCND